MATAAIVTDNTDIVFALVDDNGLIEGCLWYFTDADAISKLGVIIQQQSWGQLIGNKVFRNMDTYDDAWNFVSNALKGPTECDAVEILGEAEGIFETTAAGLADDAEAFDVFLELICAALSVAATAATDGKLEKGEKRKASIKDLLKREFKGRSSKFKSSYNDPCAIIILNGLGFSSEDKVEIIFFAAVTGTCDFGHIVYLQQPPDPPTQVKPATSSTLQWCVDDVFGNCNNGGVVVVQLANGYLALDCGYSEENDQYGYSAWYNVGSMSNVPSDYDGWMDLMGSSPNTVRRTGSTEPYFYPQTLGYVIQAKPVKGSGDTLQVTVTVSPLPTNAEMQ